MTAGHRHGDRAARAAMKAHGAAWQTQEQRKREFFALIARYDKLANLLNGHE